MRRNCLPALISLRSSDKVSSAKCTVTRITPGMRLSDVFHGNTTAASDRPGQWLDTYVTLKPLLALILLQVARIASHREDNVGTNSIPELFPARQTTSASGIRFDMIV